MFEEHRTALSPAFWTDLRELLLAAASARDFSFGSEGLRRRLEALREEHLDEEATELVRTVFAVLSAGPETAHERELCRVLATLAMNSAETAHFGADLIWLAANTPYSVFENLERAPELDQAALWDQIASYMQRALRGEPSAWRRGELLVAAAVLASSDHARARAHREALHGTSEDPLVTRVLSDGAEGIELTCQAHPLPRSAWLTWLYGFSGVLLLASLVRLGQRFLLGVERGARLRVTPQALDMRRWIRVRDQEPQEVRTFLPKNALVSVESEPRYRRLPQLFAALALLLGTAFGTGSLVEAARGGTPSLVLVGLCAIASGFVLDYVLTERWPQRRGHVRLLVRPQTGRAFRLDDVDEVAAERVMGLLQRTS